MRSGHVTTYRDRPRPSRMPLSRPSSLVGPVPSAPQVQYKNAFNADQTVPARAPRQSPFCRHVPTRHAPGWAVARAPASCRTSSLGTYPSCRALSSRPSRHVPLVTSLSSRPPKPSRHVPHQLLESRLTRASAGGAAEPTRRARGRLRRGRGPDENQKICLHIGCMLYIYITFCVSAYDVGPAAPSPIPLRRFDHPKP